MRGEDILNVLLDVEWVVGSFVADEAGQLLAYQMPPEFGEAELKRTTVRLASILRCAELCELGVEQCTLSLNRYQLLMSRFRNGFLCVMVEAPVNRRALDMATRIAVESLPALVDSLGSPPANEQTAAKHALEREGEALDGSLSEGSPEPERATEPAPPDAPRVSGVVPSNGFANGVSGNGVSGNGTAEHRDLEDDTGS